MKNELITFTNERFGNVRTIMENNDPWFVGKDVAESLGYTNSKDAIKKHIDEEDKKIIQKSQFATLEIPNRGMTIINESGLYSLIFSSKLSQAKEFKRWVTSEVLPSIRRTGNYKVLNTEDKTQEIAELSSTTLLQIGYETNRLIGENLKRDTKCDRMELYYKPSHKHKLQYNKLIKDLLGDNNTKENCKKVKDSLLVLLGNYKLYQEVPVDVLNSSHTYDLILTLCQNLNNSYREVK
jgi:prophage antirepressor-like protein